MKVLAFIVGAVVLLAGTSAAGAQTPPKREKLEAKKQSPQERVARRGESYKEQLADKLPFGSAAWWDQMRREGRLGGETP